MLLLTVCCVCWRTCFAWLGRGGGEFGESGSSEDIKTQVPDSIIGETLSVQGTVEFKHLLRIDGHFEGGPRRDHNYILAWLVILFALALLHQIEVGVQRLSLVYDTRNTNSQISLRVFPHIYPCSTRRAVRVRGGGRRRQPYNRTNSGGYLQSEWAERGKSHFSLRSRGPV